MGTVEGPLDSLRGWDGNFAGGVGEISCCMEMLVLSAKVFVLFK